MPNSCWLYRGSSSWHEILVIRVKQERGRQNATEPVLNNDGDIGRSYTHGGVASCRSACFQACVRNQALLAHRKKERFKDMQTGR